eukprot:10337155-Lingulodinium_polyedra.AAC.1
MGAASPGRLSLGTRGGSQAPARRRLWPSEGWWGTRWPRSPSCCCRRRTGMRSRPTLGRRASSHTP